MTLRRYLRLTGIGLLLSLLMGLLAAGQLMLASIGMGRGEGYTFEHAVIMQTPFWVFWAPVFPLIVWLVARVPLERGSLRPNLLIHACAAVVISLLHLTVRVWFMHIIGHGYPAGHSLLVHVQESARYRLWVHVCAYLALLAIALVSDYYTKYRERQLRASQLEAQLSQARLHALRMQLNPHFLFNALNSIAMLTRKNESANAVRMLAGLGDLLRHVLEDARADEVRLREELDFVGRYLDIERVRFGERLRVVNDIAEEALDAFVPNLVLQPLVENAIVHGLARKSGPGSIEIAARRLGDRLVLSVTDDGPGLISVVHDAPGVGLSNTRTRLEQLYGSQFALDMRNGANGGAVVTISLPFHTAPVSQTGSAA